MEIDYILIVAKLVIACGLAGLIGWERESTKTVVKGTAGLRTHMLVGLATTLIMLIVLESSLNFIDADVGKLNVIGYLMMGIGFLGAGTIMSYQGKVYGLTTAASIWLVAAIGISVAFGLYWIAIITTVIALLVLELWRLEQNVANQSKKGS
jgi:putative Mg2+ transporter-C (MgtC) family protein